MKLAENANKMHKFPYQFHKKQDQTLVTKQMSIQEKEKNHPRGAHHPRSKTYQTNKERENFEEGRKFQPSILLTMGELL
jgi:hypothetical protein